jgi:O-acetylserine/cysteine efflux transporter
MVTWGSLVAAAALLPLSLILEGTAGWQQVWHHLIEPTPIFWLCLLINAYGASLIGYSGWSWLLRRHAASQVAPFTLLVPVFGLGSAALFLGETISPGKWLGIALVFIGLGLTQAKPGRSDHTS